MENSIGYIEKLLHSFSDGNKDDIAFTVREGMSAKEITYDQFVEDITRKASYFKTNDIIDQHIALIASNCYDWIVTFFAIISTGNVAVLINHGLPVDIIQKHCAKADVSFVCCSENNIDSLRGVHDSVNIRTFNEIDMSTEENPFVFSKKADDTIIILFTSGTTSFSKAVEITYTNFQYCISCLAEIFRIPGLDSLYIPLPMYHIAGIGCTVFMLNHHKTVCMCGELKYMLADMSILNPHAAFFVPAMLEMVLNFIKNAKTKEDTEKVLGKNLILIAVGSAVLKQSVSDYLMDLGFIVAMFYGMSETTGIGTWCILDREHIGTIGKVCKHMECVICDNEILLKGPYVMKGYYKDPEETDIVLKDGWIYTGDLGYFDDDGYLYLNGRKKNVMILPNGENVNPEELEEIISDCSAVIECMVYNDNKGICMDVYTDAQDTVKEAVKNYNQSVPQYRQIYKVNYFSTPLEKTGTGKIKRKGNAYV